MPFRNTRFEVKLLEQLALIACLWQPPAAENLKQTESQGPDNREAFFNSIDPKRSLAFRLTWTAYKPFGSRPNDW
jgi:hypothetical protein